MAITSNPLGTRMPGSAAGRDHARPVSRTPLLGRVLAAVRHSLSMQQGRHRRPGPADRGALAASWTAGITRGTSLFVDDRRRG
jgi:hypothetical protein